jgi:hypothetical protein
VVEELVTLTQLLLLKLIAVPYLPTAYAAVLLHVPLFVPAESSTLLSPRHHATSELSKLTVTPCSLVNVVVTCTVAFVSLCVLPSEGVEPEK